MPWAVKTAIQAKREFVALAQSPRANVRALCRQFSVSANTAYKTLNRFRELGEAGLFDRSRRPHRVPLKTPQAVEDAVVSVRSTHPLWGGRRIAKELRAQGMTNVPAPSTITTILARRGLLYPDHRLNTLEWLTAWPKNRVELFERSVFSFAIDERDLLSLREHLLSKSVLERRRAMVVLASQRGVRPSVICKRLRLSPSTYRRCIRIFSEGKAAALFAQRRNPNRKFDNEAIRDVLFDTLHQPPANFGINRTTWKLADLSRVLKDRGHPACEDVVRQIIKTAGYRWRKARIALTSRDPNLSEKLERIQSILANIQPDEAFFSIDEYGPFAVKAQPGRSLVAPGEQRIVPQWQKSRGSITVTAAIELSSNQIAHFYSSQKNTTEMIRMMRVLVDQYRDRKRIFLSWDAASWHVSKRLNNQLEYHNNAGIGPIVETAPLPARAQFLNVIESVFSGMSRAIIQNSNYGSVDEVKAAIDRYFNERNAYFKAHPRRAGNKIWGKERVPATFSRSNNCKDPRFG